MTKHLAVPKMIDPAGMTILTWRLRILRRTKQATYICTPSVNQAAKNLEMPMDIMKTTSTYNEEMQPSIAKPSNPSQFSQRLKRRRASNNGQILGIRFFFGERTAINLLGDQQKHHSFPIPGLVNIQKAIEHGPVEIVDLAC